MNRIDQTFSSLKSAGRKALVGFFTAGDPNADASFEIIKSAADAGLDIIELGFPFSDPTCDGPVIQRASSRAIAAGASLRASLALAKRLRAAVSQPIVLFTYYNPIFKYGAARFADEAADAGADGVLAVDLPPEEAGDLSAALAAKNIHSIRLAAPTTTPQRLAALCDGAGGFLYLISRLGVTGTGGVDFAAAAKRAEEVRAQCAIPVCLGFGVSTREDAAALAPSVDGVVVGSAFVNIIETHADNPRKAAELVAAKVKELCDGLTVNG